MIFLLGCGPPSVEVIAEPEDTAPWDTAREGVPGRAETLPVFWIDADGSIGAGQKTEGTLEVIAPTTLDLDDVDEDPRLLVTAIGIEVHGSSSQGYPKKGYRLELRDSDGEDLAQELIGLPKGSDWVLHAPYSDKTLIRNALAYRLGRAMAPEGVWQPRTAFVEVYIDRRYQGLYVLTERVRRDNDRVDIAAPSATAAEGDLTGGYIVRIEQHRNEGWDTARGTPIDYHYPRYADITGEQDAYIKGWFEDLEAMLSGDDWRARYEDWLVPEAWADHYILNELAHNIDAYRLSAYLYKEADSAGGRLHAGPLWDFDRAFGNVNYCDCERVEGFVIDDLTTCGEAQQFPFWWLRLLEDPSFTAGLRCRWESLRQDLLSDARLAQAIDELVAELALAEPRDHEKWDVIGEYVDPNAYVGDSYADEVDYLRDWLLARAAWLDANLPGTCPD